MAGKIEIQDGNLVFEIQGIDVILAIKRTIKVPLSHVASVSTEKAPWALFQQLKIAGTRLPGIVKDGLYLSRDGFLFFEMHDPDKCITVTLNNEKYKKIIFEVENKENSARTINDAINGSPK